MRECKWHSCAYVTGYNIKKLFIKPRMMSIVAGLVPCLNEMNQNLWLHGTPRMKNKQTNKPTN